MGQTGPNTIESAFRAIKNDIDQVIPTLTDVIVTFEIESFDFANDYNNVNNLNFPI